jgi:hypothetical protein
VPSLKLLRPVALRSDGRRWRALLRTRPWPGFTRPQLRAVTAPALALATARRTAGRHGPARVLRAIVRLTAHAGVRRAAIAAPQSAPVLGARAMWPAPQSAPVLGARVRRPLSPTLASPVAQITVIRRERRHEPPVAPGTRELRTVHVRSLRVLAHTRCERTLERIEHSHTHTRQMPTQTRPGAAGSPHAPPAASRESRPQRQPLVLRRTLTPSEPDRRADRTLSAPATPATVLGSSQWPPARSHDARSPAASAVNVEDLTERVLRSIERRARAQRERLGGG